MKKTYIYIIIGIVLLGLILYKSGVLPTTFAVIGLQPSYELGKTMTITVASELQQSCMGTATYHLEIYRGDKSQQYIPSNLIKQMSQPLGTNIDVGSYMKSFSWTIPTTEQLGLHSISGYILCSTLSGSAALYNSPIGEQNFQIVAAGGLVNNNPVKFTVEILNPPTMVKSENTISLKVKIKNIGGSVSSIGTNKMRVETGIYMDKTLNEWGTFALTPSTIVRNCKDYEPNVQTRDVVLRPEEETIEQFTFKIPKACVVGGIGSETITYDYSLFSEAYINCWASGKSTGMTGYDRKDIAVQTVVGTGCDSCWDGIENGAESDTDCGGTECVQCGEDKLCWSIEDCQPGLACNGVTLLQKGRCIGTTDETCSDEVQNQGETGIDCGGPCEECPCPTIGHERCNDGACKVSCDEETPCTETQSCTTADNCVGTQECVEGKLDSTCVKVDPDCKAPQPPCTKTQSCTTADNCVGTQKCIDGKLNPTCVKKDPTCGKEDEITATQPSLIYKEWKEASPGMRIKTICSIDDNCAPYEDLSGADKNYTVKCKATGVIVTQLGEDYKTSCDSSWIKKVGTTLSTFGALGCGISIATTALCGVGAATPAVGAAVPCLAAGVPITIAICGGTATVATATLTGCAIWAQPDLSKGACIAIPEGDAFDWGSVTGFFNTWLEKLTQGDITYWIGTILAFALIIAFFKKRN